MEGDHHDEDGGDGDERQRDHGAQGEAAQRARTAQCPVLVCDKHRRT